MQGIGTKVPRTILKGENLRTVKYIYAVLVVIAAMGSASSLRALEAEAGLGASYFDPSDSAFRDFYKPGLSFGPEAKFFWDNGFGVGTNLDYFTSSRTYAGDKFSVDAFSLESSLLYSYQGHPLLRPYLGVGLSLNLAMEKGRGKNTVNDFDLGYLLGGGLEFKTKYVVPYVQVSYRAIPDDKGINLGGWRTGIGVQYRFPKKKSKP